MKIKFDFVFDAGLMKTIIKMQIGKNMSLLDQECFIFIDRLLYFWETSRNKEIGKRAIS